MNLVLIRCASLVGSLAVHTWVFLSSPTPNGAPRLPVPPVFVQLSVTPTPAEPKPVEPDVPKPPEPPEATKPKPKPAPPPPQDQPPEPEPLITEATPADVTPAELTGTTLVSDRGVGWAAPSGNGGERDGRIRSALARAPAPRSSGTTNAVSKRALPHSAEPPAAVPLAELSRKPSPPSLADALERNYPKEARRLGRSGEAKVRARIENNGLIRLAQVTSETSHGFGDACRTTLLASKWSVPLDQRGKPAATWVTYKCKFRVDD